MDSKSTLTLNTNTLHVCLNNFCFIINMSKIHFLLVI